MKIDLPASLDEFVAEKVKAGDYVDADEVIRDSLRRWKELEESLLVDRDWLEQELQEGIESEDLPVSKSFWTSLRNELHREHKSDARRR